jgi:hypothetical protein
VKKAQARTIWYEKALFCLVGFFCCVCDILPQRAVNLLLWAGASELSSIFKEFYGDWVPFFRRMSVALICILTGSLVMS